MLTAPTKTPYSIAPLPPAGTYAARLVNVRRFSTSFGPRVGFELELLEGQPGALVLESATDTPSPRGKLTDMIATFTGRPATDADREGDLSGLIGALCHVRISPTMNRAGKAYMRVDRLFP